VNGFLEELGKKAADRWLTLVVLPGLLWTATVAAATFLRHSAPADLRPVVDAVTAMAKGPHSAGTVVAVLAGAMLASAAAGLIASGTGVLIRRMWVLPGFRRPTLWATRFRAWRWHRLNSKALALGNDAVRNAPPGGGSDGEVIVAGPKLAATWRRRDRISVRPPARPTWIGDRWHASTARIHRDRGLDITLAWPHLWTVLPEQLRTDLTAAQSAYTTASTHTGWALLYLVPATQWWPAALIALAGTLVSTTRARSATTTLCALLEAAADLHTKTLAEQMPPPDPADGRTITALLRDPAPGEDA
jgi:hypothetical protein